MAGTKIAATELQESIYIFVQKFTWIEVIVYRLPEINLSKAGGITPLVR